MWPAGIRDRSRSLTPSARTSASRLSASTKAGAVARVWSPPQALERAHTLSGRHDKQVVESGPLVVIRRRCEPLPETLYGPVADTRDQSLQCGDTRQEHLALDQPGGGQVEQNARPLVAQPGACVQPAHQTEMLRLLAEVAVAKAAADVGGVLVVCGWAVEVALQAGGIRDVQLAGQVGDRWRWNVSRINQESSQEPDRRELGCVPKPRVVFTQLIDDAAVTIIEMEVLAQLRARGLTRIVAIAALLLGG